MNQNKLREEFYKEWINKEFTHEAIADWWLSKFDETLKDIEGELIKYKCGDHKRLLSIIKSKKE